MLPHGYSGTMPMDARGKKIGSDKVKTSDYEYPIQLPVVA